MTEEQRVENQQYYLEKCKALGWFTEENKEIWPDDPDERAEAARERFGFALTNVMDTTFLTYRNRIEENPVLSQLTEEQKKEVLKEYDELLDFVMYQFGITLDRFDHGVLEVRHSKPNEDDEMIEPVVIQPHGIFEMFQDAIRWKEEYGRGESIGRKNT